MNEKELMNTVIFWNVPFRFVMCTARKISLDWGIFFLKYGQTLHSGRQRWIFFFLHWVYTRKKDEHNWIIRSHSLNPIQSHCYKSIFDITDFESFMEFQTFWRSDCTTFLWNAILNWENMMIYVHSITKFSFIGITIWISICIRQFGYSTKIPGSKCLWKYFHIYTYIF